MNSPANARGTGPLVSRGREEMSSRIDEAKPIEIEQLDMPTRMTEEKYEPKAPSYPFAPPVSIW